jgi:hypothetical protein
MFVVSIQQRKMMPKHLTVASFDYKSAFIIQQKDNQINPSL